MSDPTIALTAIERPPLTIGADQAARLAALADNALEHAPDIASRLLDEIERARIVPDTEVPAEIVTMGSEVTFKDEASGRERVVRLVYPRDTNIEAGLISVLTPVGTGLIGLAVGQAIDWRVGDGSIRRLRIVAVKR